MTRSFNAIGQGAFYVEKFQGDKSITIVYDCGSNSKRILHKRIEENFAKDEEIHAVYISHFDNDHVNGLEKLISHCHIRKIFIPFLDESEKSLLLSFLIMKDVGKKSFNLKSIQDSFLYKFIENPDFLLNSQLDIQVIKVKVSSDSHDPEPKRFNILENIPSSVASGTEFYIDCVEGLKWLYIPYNFQYEERGEQFRSALLEILQIIPSPCNWVQLIQSKSNLIVEIKELFKSLAIEGDINSNSMVVYSGLSKMEKDNRSDFNLEYDYIKHCHLCTPVHEKKEKVGCLYTGDYDASENWEDLKLHYQTYWESIGVLQVPHHGSLLSHHKDIVNCKLDFAVISAGAKRPHGHPHEEVIVDFCNARIPWFLVTENSYSKLDFKIYLA